MATLTGVGGSATIGGMTAAGYHIFEWSLDTQREVFDDSNFDDPTNARTKVGGMYHGVGRCRATLASGQALQLADVATENAQPTAGFILKAAGTNQYTFSAMITNIAVAAVKSDRIFYDISFETSGAIAAA